MEISEVEYKELKTIEADNILAHTVLKWIDMILNGKEIDDFAMSFSIVRKVYDLKRKAEYIESVSNKEPYNFAREYLSVPITDD